MESVLETVREFVLKDSQCSDFDSDLIIGINGALSILCDLGVGPDSGYSITGIGDNWDDFLDTTANYEMAKNYVCLKTKIFFDPPSSSFVLDAMKESIKEIEWRLSK